MARTFGISSRLVSKQSDKSSNSKSKLPLTISAPVGPIKNSRGPDLTRSEKFMVVHGINDCAPDDQPNSKASETSIRLRNRISAGLKQSLSSKSMTKADSPGSQRSRKLSLSSLLPRPRFQSSASTNLLHVITEPSVKENVLLPKPETQKNVEKTEFPKSKTISKIPKSKTMNTLTELKASSACHALRSMPSTDSSTSASAESNSHSSAQETISSATLTSPTQTDKQVSPSSASSFNITNRTPPPKEPHFTEVVSAQPSAYWCGRFVSLRDRFASENLAHNQTYSFTDYGPPNTPSSPYCPSDQASTRYNTPLPTAAYRESEDEKSHRIFAYLDSCCLTGDARDSFRRWHFDYTRQQNYPSRLPGSGSVSNRGLIGRFRSSSTKPRKVDRRSRDFLDDMYYGNTSNAFGLTDLYGVDSRYLSFR